MKSLVESIISSNNASIIPDIEMDNSIRKNYNDEVWKTLFAAATYMINRSGKIRLTKITVKNSIYDYGWLEFNLEYAGRKMNQSNSLWVVSRFKDAIRDGMMSATDRMRSDSLIKHSISNRGLCQVKIKPTMWLSPEWKAAFSLYEKDEEPINELKKSIKI